MTEKKGVGVKLVKEVKGVRVVMVREERVWRWCKSRRRKGWGWRWRRRRRGVSVEVVEEVMWIPSKLVGRELGEGEGVGVLLHAARHLLTHLLPFPVNGSFI